MSQLDTAREELAALCHSLGDPAHDFAILGEGNAGVVVDGIQLVTASGSRFTAVTASDMVALDRGALVEALDGSPEGDRGDDEADDHDREADAAWSAAVARTVTETTGGVATIEAALHAIGSLVTGSAWTAHSHPVAVTGILSSDAGRRFAEGPLFPDQIVMSGPSACYIPYTDPGLPLARAFRAALHDYHARVGQWPQLVLLANHGMVALGASANEVFEITQMTDKAARIYLVAATAGTPVPLSAEAVRRIDTRSDEHYRRRALHGVNGEET